MSIACCAARAIGVSSFKTSTFSGAVSRETTFRLPCRGGGSVRTYRPGWPRPLPMGDRQRSRRVCRSGRTCSTFHVKHRVASVTRTRLPSSSRAGDGRSPASGSNSDASGGRACAPRGLPSPCRIGRYSGTAHPDTSGAPPVETAGISRARGCRPGAATGRACGRAPTRGRRDVESRLAMRHRRGPENGSAIESVRRCRGGSRELWRVTTQRMPHPRAALHAAALSHIRSVSRETWMPCVRPQVCLSRAVLFEKPTSRPVRRRTARATFAACVGFADPATETRQGDPTESALPVGDRPRAWRGKPVNRSTIEWRRMFHVKRRRLLWRAPAHAKERPIHSVAPSALISTKPTCR